MEPEFKFTYQNRIYSLNDEVHATLNINNEICPTPVKAGRLLLRSDFFLPANYVMEEIPEFSSGSVSMVLKPREGRTPDDIPIALDFHIHRPEEAAAGVQFFRSIEFNPWIYAPNPDPPTPGTREEDTIGNPKQYNILLFGIAGAGKSSCLNTIATSMEGTGNVYQPFQAGGGGDHVTTAISMIDIGAALEKPLAVNYRFWDTWGLTPQDYQGRELEYLIQGVLPPDWSIQDDVRANQGKLRVGLDEMDQRKIHSVAFLLPGSIIIDENVATAKDLVTENFRKLLREGHNPVVVVTRLDEFFPELRQNPLVLPEKCEEVLRKTALTLGIGRGQITYCINYLDEHRTNSKIGKNSLTLVYRLVHAAKTFVNYRRQLNA